MEYEILKVNIKFTIISIFTLKMLYNINCFSYKFLRMCLKYE